MPERPALRTQVSTRARGASEAEAIAAARVSLSTTWMLDDLMSVVRRHRVRSEPARDVARSRPVCPRCLGIEPGVPGGSPEHPYMGPVASVLCSPCEAIVSSRLAAERGEPVRRRTVDVYLRVEREPWSSTGV